MHIDFERSCRRAVRLAVIAVAGATCTLAACSNFSSADAPGTDAGDGGATDATSDGPTAPDVTTNDASSADAAEAPNLLTNGDFELGCAGWSASSASVVETMTAHGGAKSCLVCALTPGQAFNIGQFITPIVPGALYVGRAFVRAPAGGDASPPPTNRSGLIVRDATGNLDLAHQFTPGPPLDSTWKPTSSLLRNDADGGVQLVFFIEGAVDGCFLIDDARLYVQP